MCGEATDRCGYTFPDDCEQVDPDEFTRTDFNRSCCFRETVPDSDRCAWHVDPDETDHKTRSALRSARGSFGDDADIAHIELLDGANLRGIELDSCKLMRGAAVRGGEFVGSSLRGTSLTDVDLVGADLTDADLFRTSLTDAGLRHADLIDADL